MLRDALIATLNWRLGNRKFDERIIAEMPFVQSTILEGKEWCPWFLETELAHASVTPGESRVVLPEDFLMEIEEQDLVLVTAAGAELPLDKLDMDKAERKFPGTGQPQVYAISARYFHFFPCPVEEYVVETRYYGRDTDMAAQNVETAWLKHAPDVVLAELGQILAGKHLQNPNLAAQFGQDAAAAWDRLYKKHTAMGELNKSRVMNGG